MNCPEAQRHIFVDRELAQDPIQRAQLEQHIAHCAECERIRDDLSAALMAWRSDTANAPVPNAEHEWHAVRRRIRGANVGAATSPAQTRRHFLAWLTVPAGAAAALAIAFYVGSSESTPSAPPAASIPAAQVARADSVEVPGNTSATVFVDDKSGWLIVWASDARPNQI